MKPMYDEFYSEEWLLMTLLDLWSAGMETTKITLNWAFTFLLLHPEVMPTTKTKCLDNLGLFASVKALTATAESSILMQSLKPNIMTVLYSNPITTFCFSLMKVMFLILQVKSHVEEELLSVTKGQRHLSINDRQNTPHYNAVLTVSQNHFVLL